jgi:hypothetical protein
MQYRDLSYRIHARKSMYTRSISDECVEHIIQDGEVIEDYPDAFQLPAKLLLGWYLHSSICQAKLMDAYYLLIPFFAFSTRHRRISSPIA